MTDSNPPLQFEFRISEEVRITDLKVTGFVLARCDRGTFREYRVRYFWEGAHRDEWLLEGWLKSL